VIFALLELLLFASVPLLFAYGLGRHRTSAGPAEVVVVYGRRSMARHYTVLRGSTLVLPFLEAAETVSVEPLTLTLPEATATVRFPLQEEALYRCFDCLGIRARSELAELASDAVAGGLARAKSSEDAEHEVRDALGTLGLELESLRAAAP
jgi:hypothetical protein